MKNSKLKDPLLPLAKLSIGFLVLLTIGIFAYGKLKSQDEQIGSSSIVASRELHFYDTSDGKILITDTNGANVSLVGREGGFMRAVLRSLAKDRLDMGIGPEEPFKLIANQMGLISIVDPVTGKKVDVSSFGQVNAEIFTTLLSMPKNVTNEEEG